MSTEHETPPSRRAMNVRFVAALVCWGVGFWVIHEDFSFDLLMVCFAAFVVLLGWDAPFRYAEAKQRFLHPNGPPDPDLEALKNGAIDISEYRRRKDRRENDGADA